MKISITISDDSTVSISEDSFDGIEYKTVTVKYPRPTVPSPIKLEWMFKSDDIYSTWSPVIRGDRGLNPDWNKRQTDSRLNSGAPLHSLISSKGKNRLCIALSDAFTPTKIATGICEEQAAVECCVELFSKNSTTAVSEYSTVIRLDTRDIAYEDSIRDAVSWWENECGYRSAPVPEAAMMPMDSLWYSFHQNLSSEEIINECKEAKLLGMNTVIIDDGWQTDNSSRGYAYCGDWKASKNKISDMRALADKVHALDMKLMLWFSVPYVGIHSEAYSKFSGMLLNGPSDEETVFLLDPRYSKVRSYLTDIYEKAVSEWDLDGLKLDFIDCFYLTDKSEKPDAARDTESLEASIDMLVSEIVERVQKVKPDILIEFRHSYIGPAMRQYGNILRVTDCPMDALRNRGDIINLRLTSGSTAVHSDMLMWNSDASIETAALQLCCVMYGVPQISMRADKLSKDHKDMLKYYLSFWKKYRDVLLAGKLYANNPESNYSLVFAEKDGVSVYTAYTNPVIHCSEIETVAINSTMSDMLIIADGEGKGYKVVDCKGAAVETGTVTSELFKVNVPSAGMVFVK